MTNYPDSIIDLLVQRFPEVQKRALNRILTAEGLEDSNLPFDEIIATLLVANAWLHEELGVRLRLSEYEQKIWNERFSDTNQSNIYLKLLEMEPELRSHLIKLAGGSKELASLIAQALDINVAK
jgi:hypothetical protein